MFHVPNRIRCILQVFLQAPSSGSPDSSSSAFVDTCKFDLWLGCGFDAGPLSAFFLPTFLGRVSAHHRLTGNHRQSHSLHVALFLTLLTSPMFRLPYSLSVMVVDGSQRRGNGYCFSGPSGGVPLGAGTTGMSSSSMMTGGEYEHQPRQHQSKRYSVSFDESKAKRRRLLQEQVIYLVFHLMCACVKLPL